MVDFFNLLSDFLKSDLAKSYGWVIFVSFIIAVSVVGIIIWFILFKLIVPVKLFEANNTKNENQELKIELEKSQKRVKELEKQLTEFKFEKSIKDSSEFEDKALKQFVN